MKSILKLTLLSLFCLPSFLLFSQTDDKVFEKVDQMPVLDKVLKERARLLVTTKNPKFELTLEEESNKHVSELIRNKIPFPEGYQFQDTLQPVEVSFVVDTNGLVLDPKIIKTPDTLLNQKIIESILKLPAFIPGKISNRKVKVRMVIPVIFKVQEELFSVYEPDAPVYLIVQQMPLFPGTKTDAESKDAIRNFVGDLAKNYTFDPRKWQECRVFVSFVIGADGNVHQIKILRGCYPEFNNIARNLVGKLPRFTPGKQQGKNVNVGYTLPIMFKY